MTERCIYHFAPKIVFGPASMASLAQELRRLGVRRALLVIDPAVAALGLGERVQALCREAGAEAVRFTDVSPNPTDQQAEAGLAAFRAAGADGVVGVGGGSALDIAKAVRLLATHGGKVRDWRDAAGGWDRIRPDLPPLIACPTTAGTGSEVALGFVVTDTERNVKIWTWSPHLYPVVAIVDPQLTLTVPPTVTAATGFDVLAHGVEAFAVARDDPLADALAADAVVRVLRSLERVVAHGEDLAARTDMARASFQSVMAVAQKGLGAAHALGHQLTTTFGLSHGATLAITLPRVMRFNQAAVADRYAALARRTGVSTAPSDAEASAALVDRVEALIAAVGLSGSLAPGSVTPDRIAAMVGPALEDGCMYTNPRPLSAHEAGEIYAAL